MENSTLPRDLVLYGAGPHCVHCLTPLRFVKAADDNGEPIPGTFTFCKCHPAPVQIDGEHDARRAAAAYQDAQGVAPASLETVTALAPTIDEEIARLERLEAAAEAAQGLTMLEWQREQLRKCLPDLQLMMVPQTEVEAELVNIAAEIERERDRHVSLVYGC